MIRLNRLRLHILPSKYSNIINTYSCSHTFYRLQPYITRSYFLLIQLFLERAFWYPLSIDYACTHKTIILNGNFRSVFD